jgi:HEAT repeat protein
MPQPSLAAKTETSSLNNVFSQLAEYDVGKFTIFFRRLRETYPHEAIRSSLQYLGTHPMDTAARQMAIWLGSGDAYVSVLLDPDFLPVAEARRTAAALRDTDRQFFSKLSQLDSRNVTSLPLISRALTVLEDLGDLTVLIPWLRMMTKHEDQRIQSKAVKVLCQVRCNKELVERQLQSKDARTRANAVEAMWNAKTAGASEVFHSVLEDPDARVVVNALVGLYFHEEERSLDRITALASSPSPQFRAAIAWALEHIHDRQGLATLEALATDSSEKVRNRALRALATFTPVAIADEE